MSCQTHFFRGGGGGGVVGGGRGSEATFAGGGPFGVGGPVCPVLHPAVS